MGAITGMFGLAGGQSGTGIQGPQYANVTNPVTPDQLSSSYGGVNNSLASQQALLAAIQGQNGLGNQSQVYNQLQGIANGTGPNPAQQQYQNNVNQIAQQQAGAIASQRGISPALQSELMSQQAGLAKTNAAGAGAEALANQQLNAIGAAGNMANQQSANQIGATGMNTQANLQNQGNLLGAMGGYNNSLTSGQGSINAANAGMAGNMINGQAGVIQGIGGALGLMKSGGAGGAASPAAAAPAGAAMAHGGLVDGPRSFVGKHLMSMKSGGQVPGKPKVAGDNPKNDTVPAVLSPKEIVIPNSITMSKDAPKKAADFVAKVLKSKGMRK